MINGAIIEQNKKVRIVKPLVIERMTVLEKGNITIHTENIFPIIKKSLYTDHEIFLRELISNSVDAISKLKMASLAGEARGEVPEPEINLAIDKENRTLSITDNGIGMTAEEIK